MHFESNYLLVQEHAYENICFDEQCLFATRILSLAQDVYSIKLYKQI